MGGRGSTSGITHNSAKSNLPELQGTEKQIAWAKQIREDALETAGKNIKLNQDRLKQYGPGMKNMYEPRIEAYKQVRQNLYTALTKISNASDIIDKRHIISADMVTKEADRIEEQIRKKKKK